MRVKISGLAAVVASVLALGTLTSCTGGSEALERNGKTWTVQNRDSFALEDATTALYLSTQTRDHAKGRGIGYVVLSNGKSERVFRTAGMDVARLAWDDSGLFFSDRDNDYLVNDSVTVIPSKKPDLQQALFALGGGSFVGLFNEGYTDDGYAEVVVESDGARSVHSTVEGSYSVTANCDGTLYGVSAPTGKYESFAGESGLEIQGEMGYTALMLQQLSGAPEPGERLADLRAVSDSDQLAMDAPCKNDTVHFLATSYEASAELRPPVLRSWNVNDQTLTERLLVDERGTPAPVTHPSYGFMVDGMNSHSPRDGNLDWMGVFNSVNTTELSTGVTRELFTVPGDIDVAADLRASTFTDTSFVSATIWDERDKATVTIQDRLTGDVTSTFEVPFAVRARDQGLILRSVAVRPGL